MASVPLGLPGGDVPLSLEARFAEIAVGRIAHLVPVPGLQADGWVRRIELQDSRGERAGFARWTVRIREGEEACPLVVRTVDQQASVSVRCGRLLERAWIVGNSTTEIRLAVRPPIYRPFRLIDERWTAGVSPWLVGNGLPVLGVYLLL